MSPKGKPPLFYFMCMIHIKCALLASMFEFLRKIDSILLKKVFSKLFFKIKGNILISTNSTL